MRSIGERTLINSRRDELIATRPRGERVASPHGGTAESLRKVIGAIQEAWPALSRRETFRASVTCTREGLILGAGTRLARAVKGEEARALGLLSVTFDRALPASVLENLKRAETEFHAGDLAKSAMHIALANLPPLAERGSAYRLHIAAALVDQGCLTPLDLMRACELDTREVEALTKYNPDQPRVPAGNSDGGQWAREGGGQGSAANRETREKHSKPIRTAIVMPEGCDKEWAFALEYCDELLRRANPPKSLTGGYRDPSLCAKGFVSERCGGNPVTGRIV
jgi:hypothetical protein